MTVTPSIGDVALGATVLSRGARFAVRSRSAEQVFVCLFVGENEAGRVEMQPAGDGLFLAEISGLQAGARYGLRADGPYDPSAGLWFDPDKLLVDPYAIAIDRPYAYDTRLAVPRANGGDTFALVPKAVLTELPPPVQHRPPCFSPGGLIYEVNVRAFTMLHPDIPPEQRGTIAALAHPVIVAHLKKIGVAAIELMPVVAWIDERHLPALGLRNAWGYNPVTFKPIDPRLAPGGLAELRQTVAALHEAGIGTILDLVFNHTGESDALGPTLSLRGLDSRSFYRNMAGNPGRLINDTGTGNTIACDQPEAVALIMDALRHFVINAGVDGFRFDLATVLGRTLAGFDPQAPLLQAILDDPALRDRVLIAEPWDIGTNGYQLGAFPAAFGEWNDRFRDDVRCFWRGDAGMIGTLATRLAGSSDVFRRAGETVTRSIGYLAAHDGFALADVVSFRDRHNEANGEQNRDGHGENLSWNNGVEGETTDASIRAARRRDLRALLSTLFASRGAIMLTAGDEFGRTQHGNNNAYAQDNAISWLDWVHRDIELEDHVAAVAAFRSRWRLHGDNHFLEGVSVQPGGLPDVEWLSEEGMRLADHEWSQPGRHRMTMVLAVSGQQRVAVAVNGDRRACPFMVPTRAGFRWTVAAGTDRDVDRRLDDGSLLIRGRSVIYLYEDAVTASEETRK